MDTVVLVDGSNMFHRAFFAVKYGGRSANISDRLSRGLLEAHTFIKMLLAHIGKFAPCSLVICWDGNQRSIYRSAIYPDYKSQRKKDPEDQKRMAMLRSVMGELFPRLGFLEVTVNGVEADDLICYFYRLWRKDYNIVILSADSDLRQFDGSVVCDLSGRTIVVDRHTAKLAVMQKAVCGDTSDNIKGVGGVGPKKFQQLMSVTGPDIDAVIGHFSSDMELVERLRVNYQLVNLMVSNKEVMLPEVKCTVLKTFKRFCRVKFNRREATMHCMKLGLRDAARILNDTLGGTLESSHDKTSRLIRCTLRQRCGRRPRHTINV